MRVVKHIGSWDVAFDGEPKAVNAFTAIHGVLSSRGYGIGLPEQGGENRLLVPGVGEVQIKRTAQNESGLKKDGNSCYVELLHGAIASRLMHLLD